MKKNRMTIVVVIAFLFGIASVHIANRGTLELMTSYALYPFIRLQYMVIKPVQELCAHRDRMKQAARYAQELEAQRDSLMEENIKLRSSIDYVADIKELIDFSAQYAVEKQRCVQLLLKHTDNAQHYVLVDAGSDHGITPDMVAVYKNVLLGKVVEVYPQYSKVLLITDKTCKVAAYCAETGATGIHEGSNGDATILNRVSHLSTVQEGALVLSSGVGTVFPRGFALGQVTACALNGMVYDVQVQPLVDIERIEYCYLVKKGETPQGLLAESEQPAPEEAPAITQAPVQPVKVAHAKSAPVRTSQPAQASRMQEVKVAARKAVPAVPAAPVFEQKEQVESAPVAGARVPEQEMSVASVDVERVEVAPVEAVPVDTVPVVAEKSQRKKKHRKWLQRSQESEHAAAPSESVVIAHEGALDMQAADVQIAHAEIDEAPLSVYDAVVKGEKPRDAQDGYLSV